MPRPTAAPARSLGARLPLVAVLAVVLQLELVLNRIVARLLHRDLLTPPGWLRTTVDVGGLFSFYFAGALAVFVATLGLLRVLLYSTTIPRGARGAMSALGVAFVPLLLLGLWVPLPGALHLYLQASFTGLAVMLMLSGVLSRIGARAKLGLVAVTLPLGFHLAGAIVIARNPTAQDLTRALVLGGEVALLAAALLGLLLLSPAKDELRRGAAATGVRGWALPVAMGVVVAGAAFAMTQLSWDMAARLAIYAFGIELPIPKGGVVIVVIGLGAWVTLVARLLVVPGRARLRGYGLLLLGLAGFQLAQPGQLAAVLVGVMAILTSFEPEPTANPEEWKSVVAQVATIVGAGQVNVGGGEGDEEARMRFLRGNESIELTLTRRGGDLSLVEIVCGVAPAGTSSSLALTRRGTERLGKSTGAIVATGDVAFDELFRVSDGRELDGPDPILDDEVRTAAREQLEGWLAVWPGQGVRYRARRARFVTELLANVPTARTSLLSLLDLLVQIRLR